MCKQIKTAENRSTVRVEDGILCGKSDKDKTVEMRATSDASGNISLRIKEPASSASA